MNTRIPIIAFSVFCMVILLAQNNLPKVYAFSTIDRVTGGSNNYTDLVDNTVATGGCQYYMLTTLQKLSSINCNNHAVTRDAVTLPTTGTVCNNNGLSAPCNLGTGTFSGLECVDAFCFVVFTNATRGLLTRFQVSGVDTILNGWVLLTTTQAVEAGGFDVFKTTDGLSITVWIGIQCSPADSDRIIAIVDGVSMIQSVVGVDASTSCAGSGGGNLGAVNVNDIKTVLVGSTRYLGVTTNGASNNFRVFNLATNSFFCQKTSAVSNSGISFDSDHNEWLLPANALNGDIDRIENDASCTDNGDITDVTLGTTGFSLAGSDVNTARDEIYVNANNGKVHTINSTSLTKVWEFAMGSTAQLPIKAITKNSTEVVSSTTDATATRFLIISTGTGTGATSQTCIETVTGSGIADLCFIDTDGNGVADNGQLGALGAYRSNANLTSFATDVFCAFGINTQACTNKDIKTNGAGITLLLLLIIISYAFLVFIHYQAQRMLHSNNVQVVDALSINPMLLIVVLMIDVSIAFYMSWIPDLIFYTLIVIMVAFASFGIYKRIKSGGD